MLSQHEVAKGWVGVRVRVPIALPHGVGVNGCKCSLLRLLGIHGPGQKALIWPVRRVHNLIIVSGEGSDVPGVSSIADNWQEQQLDPVA